MIMVLALWLTLAPAKPPKLATPVQAQPQPKPATPLAVVRVERDGPPPYAGRARLYRIEGDGLEQLGLGDILQLHRAQDDRVMPRLEVTQVMPDHVLARVEFPGETYPMVGDLVRARGVAEPLPALPALLDTPLGRDLPEFQAARPELKAPGALFGFTARQEPLYFVLGESRITPAGLAKLQAWAQAWGPDQRWFLTCAQFPSESVDLCSARAALLQDELQRLGISQVELRIVTDQAPGKYPVIFVGAEPW